MLMVIVQSQGLITMNDRGKGSEVTDSGKECRQSYRLVWEGQPMTEGERAVGSLIWMGRIFILLWFVVAGFVIGAFRFVWLALAMLLIYPLYVVIFWRAIRSGGWRWCPRGDRLGVGGAVRNPG